MLKKLIVATAASALMAGTAAAQQASPPAKAPTAPPPAASQPAPKAPETKAMPDTKAQDMTRAPAAAQPGQAQATFVNTQRPDQLLFSSFNGTDVIGADNQKIGDVSDILFDKTGKIEAYVVGVGGFLGIGSKNVALAPSAFEAVPGDKSKNESDKLRLSMTKEQLQKAASFEPYKEPRSTTGMGGGTARPAPGGAGAR
ncbi:MAG: PRC-barrel domain containing protein [Alphaproteobacteria bacterium]|nr:PRC-barrel domain containing protein [Alphaproteobacteria bacterium]